MPPSPSSPHSKTRDIKDSLLDELKIITGARRKQVAKDAHVHQESRRRSGSRCSRKEGKAAEKREKEPEVIEVAGAVEIDNIPSDGLADIILPKGPPSTAPASESIVDKIKNSLKSRESSGEFEGDGGNADDKPGLVWEAIDKKVGGEEQTTSELVGESAAKSTNPLPPAPAPPPANHVGQPETSVIDRQALDESGNRLLASLTLGCFSDDLRKSAADLVSLSRG